MVVRLPVLVDHQYKLLHPVYQHTVLPHVIQLCLPYLLKPVKLVLHPKEYQLIHLAYQPTVNHHQHLAHHHLLDLPGHLPALYQWGVLVDHRMYDLPVPT